VQIRDIMSQPVQTIDVFASAHEAAAVMALHSVGALLVMDDERLVGIVTDRDLIERCVAKGTPPELVPVRAIMTPDPITASPRDTLETTALVLGDHAIRRLPVVERGRVVGIVSVDDIARFCADDVVIGEMMRRIATYTVPPTVHAGANAQPTG
jgi:CBS domain-containing protein